MSSGNLRVVHAYLSEERGGEFVIWTEDERLWPPVDFHGHERGGGHPFAPGCADLRAGIGKQVGDYLNYGDVPHMRVQAAGELEAFLRGDYRYRELLAQEKKDAALGNRRQVFPLLPSAHIGPRDVYAPLPSPALAQALGFELPQSAELDPWLVRAYAVAPTILTSVTAGVYHSNANIAPASSLLFYANLVRRGFELIASGALCPSAGGWEFPEPVIKRVSEQLAASVPGEVAFQYDCPQDAVARALSVLACQFALGALQFAEKYEGFVLPLTVASSRWVEALQGTRRVSAPPEQLIRSNTDRLIDSYAREHKNPSSRAVLPAKQAAIVNRWAQSPCPDPALIAVLPELSLTLKAPEQEELWSLRVTLQNADQADAGQARAALAAAAQHCPQLAPVSALPALVQLDAAQVIGLLGVREPLAAHGFELDIPPELEELCSARSRTVLSEPKTETGGPLCAQTLCSYHFEVGIDGEWLTAEELAVLVAAKAPLVRVRGRWHRLHESALQRAVELLSTGEQTTSLFGALRIAQGLDRDKGPDGEDDSLQGDAPQVSAALLSLLDGQMAGEIVAGEQPPAFRGEMRSYQRFGLGWLQYLEARGFGACLADDMGLGKTVQCLALLESERDRVTREQRGPTLLVVPFSAVSNWEEEAEKFCPQLKLHVHHGSDRHAGGGLAAALVQADVCLTTYDLLVRDREALQSIEWHRICFDEVQMIKNDYTKVAQAAFGLRSPRRVALSGTPVENRLAELWSVMHLLNPGLLGSRAAFATEFITPVERDSDQEAAARLRALVAPFILRRTKADPEIRAQLPAKIERTRACPLSADQAALYQATVEQMLSEIELSQDAPRRGLIFKAITELKQICNHPLAFAEDDGPIAGRSGKLAELERIAADARAVSEKTLCFTQYPSFARRIAPHLAERLGCAVEVFDGTLNPQKRKALRHRFATDPDLGLLLVSYGAGGKALNLTAANHVVLFDRWWNPAVESQAEDRAYRIGQCKDVYVHRLLSAGTLEERIEEMLARKRALADLVITSLGAEIVALDNTALRALLSLSGRALQETWGDR